MNHQTQCESLERVRGGKKLGGKNTSDSDDLAKMGFGVSKHGVVERS